MRNKRFVTIAEYQRLTGLSYQTIKNAIETCQLTAIKTSTGNYKIDTQADNVDVTEIYNCLAAQQQLLEKLCSHLGVKA